MAKDYEVLNELTPKTVELHRAIFDKGYEQGYERGLGKAEQREDYERGLNDAWTCAHKITGNVDKGGLPYYALFEIFGHNAIANIFTDYSPSECIQKIKEYEKKHNDEMKIGDEVITPDGHKGVIVYTNQYQGTAMLPDGSIRAFLKTEYKKTGKTFPQITEIFNDLKGEIND